MTEPQIPPIERPPRAHGGHGLMMIVCCIPMIILAVALVATGVVGAGFLLWAAVCTAMMVLMMRVMGGSRESRGP